MPSENKETNEKLALDVREVTKRFQSGENELVVLDALDLQIPAGQSVAIMGPSGSGKSTLLQILGTLDKPTDGNILLDGEDPTQFDEKKLARFRNYKIGFIFQDHQLLPQCTALENVLIPVLADNDGKRSEHLDRARELLDKVGLAERAEHRPSRLSGGEKQRVAVARALIRRPTIVLADEPTGSLDEKTGDKIAEIFQSLLESENIALVIATHDPDFAKRFDRLLHLHQGKLQEKQEA